MYTLEDNLILYSFAEESGLLNQAVKLAEVDSEDVDFEINRIVRTLLSFAAEHGFDGNLWHGYIAYHIAMNENPFSLIKEKRNVFNGGMADMAKKDCKVLRKLFNLDAVLVKKYPEIDSFVKIRDFNNVDFKVSDESKAILQLRDDLEEESSDDELFFQTISRFYERYGTGALGLSKTFTVKVDDGKTCFSPVRNTENIRLSDLIGYEIQKQRLEENTKAFLNKKPANNVLLFGDGGTGKSTSIRAIANQYYEDGLRIIQVYRHQMKYLSQIIDKIKKRNYRFIIYMDDLSFEDFETEYKYLKAVIEGGLEARPENVFIYATSNRRHLIKETWNDRNDVEQDQDMHRSDSMAEKLSLSERFGVQIYYGKPSKDEFHKIVETLALRENIKTDLEELRKEATKWEIRHGGVSGRSARQFIDYIKGTEENTR